MIFDFNIMSEFWLNNYSYLSGGISYRLADAVALNLGYAFSPAKITSINMMKIGYSFDIMTNPLNTYGKGTHELMLNFCVPITPSSSKTRKSIYITVMGFILGTFASAEQVQLMLSIYEYH